MKLSAFILLVTIIASGLGLTPAAGQAAAPQSRCSALDKDRLPVLISFDGVDDKAWDGDRYVKGALLRVRNNSNCAILFEANPGQASSFRVRDGKLIRLDMEEAKDGQRLSFRYLMKYPNQESMVLGGFGGDVLDYVRLNGGDSVLLSVPLRTFKKGGELVVPFAYEPRGGYRYGAEPPTEQYIRFGRQSIPGKLLR